MRIGGAGVLLALAALTASFGERALASAPTSTPPIHVLGCSVPSYIHASGTYVTISYVNTTSTTVKQVDFGLVRGQAVFAEVRDVGAFAPGKHITHEFAVNAAVFETSRQLACRPMRVIFENGAIWTDPRLSSAVRAPY